MRIQYKNYTLEPEKRNYNLYKTVPCKVKGVDTTREENFGFGLKFETAIETVVKDIMADRDETISLRQYISEYKKIANEILNILEYK